MLHFTARIRKSKGTCDHLVLTSGGRQEVAALVSIEIVEDDGLFYLFRYDASGRCVADTCHFSVEEAHRQATFEFDPVEEQ